MRNDGRGTYTQSGLMRPSNGGGFGCGCLIGLSVLGFVFAALAILAAAGAADWGPLGSGTPSSDSEASPIVSVILLVLSAVCFLVVIGAVVLSVAEGRAPRTTRSGVPQSALGRIICLACGEPTPPADRCRWCNQSIDHDLDANGRGPEHDDLLTCPSCGQRTAPGAECQWCDEPIGGEG